MLILFCFLNFVVLVTKLQVRLWRLHRDAEQTDAARRGWGEAGHGVQQRQQTAAHLQPPASAHHPPEEVRGVQLQPAQGQPARPVRREARPGSVLLFNQPGPASDAAGPAASAVLAVRRGGAQRPSDQRPLHGLRPSPPAARPAHRQPGPAHPARHGRVQDGLRAGRAAGRADGAELQGYSSERHADRRGVGGLTDGHERCPDDREAAVGAKAGTGAKAGAGTRSEDNAGAKVRTRARSGDKAGAGANARARGGGAKAGGGPVVPREWYARHRGDPGQGTPGAGLHALLGADCVDSDDHGTMWCDVGGWLSFF